VKSVVPERFSPRWWVSDRAGRLAVVSAPNPALAVWLFCTVVGWTDVLDAERSDTLTAIGKGALVVWALDEVVRGASPVRRILGAVVLVAQLARLFA
jgi:hypothetical protein